MNAVELAAYIFENKGPFPEAFLHDLKSSAQFEKFVVFYRDKIRKKIRECYDNDECIKDVLAEMKLAYALLQIDRFSKTEFECYDKTEPHPDLTVTDNVSGIVFNAEVKRIRRTDAERRFETWLRHLKERIRAVPSKLALSMEIGDFNTPIDLLDRLETKTEDIVSYITRTIVALDKEIPPGSEMEFPVPGFEDVFEVRLRKPLQKSLDHTLYSFGIYPEFITHREYKKFGDLICDPTHLRQMRPDMINILAITTDSSTHEDFDLDTALDSLKELVISENDQFFSDKGFASSADFTTQLERLSGILFVGASVYIRSTPTVLWHNNKAKHPIPEDIVKLLQAIIY